MAHFLQTLLSFAVVLGILVFIHELGHYLAARWRGIYVEAFSIGFGPKLAAWTDRRGTVWKLCALPLGGYVKMHGMAVNVADEQTVDATVTRPGEGYFEKSVASRAIVAAAGPAANFVLAIVLFTCLFSVVGRPVQLPIVGEVVESSAAAAAGLQKGDAITAVDGKPVATFEALRQIVAASPGRDLALSIAREGKAIEVTAHIRADHSSGRLGVSSGGTRMERLDPFRALIGGITQTGQVLWMILAGLAHIVTTGQGVRELGGPLQIAQLSGQVAQLGLASLLSFIAMLSINLGLVNLLPIPVLDGGHLMFYAAEAIRGRPLPARAQDYGYRIGFALIASLFLVISWNDLVRTGAVRWVTSLIG